MKIEQDFLDKQHYENWTRPLGHPIIRRRLFFFLTETSNALLCFFDKKKTLQCSHTK